MFHDVSSFNVHIKLVENPEFETLYIVHVFNITFNFATHHHDVANHMFQSISSSIPYTSLSGNQLFHVL